MPKLPNLNRLKRMNEHDYLQNQTIPDPKQQHDLCGDKDRKRPQPTKLPRDQQTDATANDVSHRVHDRVAVITQGGRRFTISIDDSVRVFQNFPNSFQNNRYAKPPTGRHPARHQQQYAGEHKTMQQVREAVGIEKSLRGERAPRVRGPHKPLAVAPPVSALSMQLQRRQAKTQHNEYRRQKSGFG